MNKMLQNPDITPQNRLLLQAQLQAVNATVLQSVLRRDIRVLQHLVHLFVSDSPGV
jgi:hypothetical protein